MKKILLLAATLFPLCAQVTITPKGSEKITIDIDGKPFTEFWIGRETKKPYLHPLRTASGTVGRAAIRWRPTSRARPTTILTIVASGSHTAMSTATISGATRIHSKAQVKGKGTVALKRSRRSPAAKRRNHRRHFRVELPCGQTRSREARKMTSTPILSYAHRF